MQLIRGINKILDRNNFTLKKYQEFLESISRYKVLPLCEFNKYHNESEVVIGLRHDIDHNIESARLMAGIEFQKDIRSTYFFLHTANYYRELTETNFLKYKYGRFEIGIHNDLMSIKEKPAAWLFNELTKFRSWGLDIVGTSAHGNHSLPKGVNNLNFWDYHQLWEFGLEYEAYSLNHNKYFSDCTFIDGHRWHPGMIDWSQLKPGDRIQILIHPEIWGNKLYL